MNSKKDDLDKLLNTIIDDLDNIQQNDLTEQTQDNTLLHKAELMALTNGWNDNNEKIIISIGENAASYKWMHERSASMYTLIHKILGILLILFTTGLTAETIFPDTTSNAFTYARYTFTYIVTIISVIQNFLNLESLAEQHMNAANKFAVMYHEIQQQMCMYRRDRYNATGYISNTLKKYDSLVISGPMINDIIIRKFKRAFANSDISLPDVADNIQKIDIINEPKPKTANLKTIHNAFQIHGDLSDKDIQNANPIELKELKKHFWKEKSIYEYQRFLNHNEDFD